MIIKLTIVLMTFSPRIDSLSINDDERIVKISTIYSNYFRRRQIMPLFLLRMQTWLLLLSIFSQTVTESALNEASDLSTLPIELLFAVRQYSSIARTFINQSPLAEEVLFKYFLFPCSYDDQINSIMNFVISFINRFSFLEINYALLICWRKLLTLLNCYFKSDLKVWPYRSFPSIL